MLWPSWAVLLKLAFFNVLRVMIPKPYLPQAPLSRAVFLENYWGKSYQAIPRHSADVADLLADACGVSIGLALAYTRLGRVLLWIKSAFTTNPGQDG